MGTLAIQGAEAPILENQIPKIGWKYYDPKVQASEQAEDLRHKAFETRRLVVGQCSENCLVELEVEPTEKVTSSSLLEF